MVFCTPVREDRAREPWSLLAYLCLALAVMTKGFVGLFPLVVLATYGLLSGSFHALRGLRSVWGGLLFSLLIVPWHLIMGWQHEGYFWHYFANEHFLRFLGRRYPMDFISLPLPIFSLVLFLWLLPWSPYLALAIPRQWPQLGKPLPREDAGHLLMLLWASMFLLFFALSRARLPQYCLPAMPALALLIGMSLDKRYTGSISSTTGLLIATAISALLPALALFLLPSYLGQYHQLGLSERAVSLIRVVFSLMVGASALAFLSFARRRWLGGLASLTVGMVAAFYCTHQVLLELQPFRSSQGLAKLIAADPRPGGRIVLEVEKDDPFEHEKIAGLVFYTGQSIDLLRRNPPRALAAVETDRTLPAQRDGVSPVMDLIRESLSRHRFIPRWRWYPRSGVDLHGDGTAGESLGGVESPVNRHLTYQRSCPEVVVERWTGAIEPRPPGDERPSRDHRWGDL
jgi:hypothetical protein